MLLTAKAPLKTKSLPRLKLCAGHLLVKCWQSIEPTLVGFLFFLTDTEIVLQLIKSHLSTVNTFVSNRVAEIQECGRTVTWCHVPIKENPTEITSRGCRVTEL